MPTTNVLNCMNREDLKKYMATVAIHEGKLPTDLKTAFQTFFELADFYINVYTAMADETREPLTRLAKEHYPELLTATHPLQIEYIEDANTTTVFGLVYQMRGIVRDMAEGTDILAKYPKMEQWKDFYFHRKPSVVKESHRNVWLHKTDEEWEQYKEQENRAMYQFFCWEEQRKKEFYDIVQPVLFKLYPPLNDLEGDFWVLYAVNLRDEYECWLSSMEHLQGAIEYEMPPESINWDDEKFRKEYSARYKVYRNRKSKRNEMIDSFVPTISFEEYYSKTV